jgi:ATP-dependent Lhr-like helicase
MSAFARFPPRLQEAIVGRVGWTSLRPVQDLAGEAILDGKNAVVLAPTAGGKTEAAIFPVIASLIERPTTSVGAIYIAPIKALLNNQEARLGTYAEMVGLRRFVWHGDVSDADRKRFTREPTDLLMTTPESLEVMLVSTKVSTSRLFSDLRFVILDEVHALAGTDRGAHLLSVIERLVRETENDVQRIGLSATVGNPAAILTWLTGSSRREGVVIDPPKPTTKRQIAILSGATMLDLAREAVPLAANKKSLFFCQSRALTETVAGHLRAGGTEVFVHHSSVSLEERQAAEASFHQGTNVCIACTSTLELGIDVGDLDAVFQADAPSTVSSFLQRMGRTGRRTGTVANMTFFCESSETVLQAVALVELGRAGWVESIPSQRRCWPVLVHQLLAMTLQFGGISVERCWEQLSRVPDFSGIGRVEFDGLIAHLLEDRYLFESGGLLSLGEQAERVYGRKNFFELYAVFSSPTLYTVKTASGREIGSLEQDFVDRLVEGMTSFLLGGRAWTVQHVNHADRTIRVGEAPRGIKPSWSAFTPQTLGFAVCQEMRRILVTDAAYPYLHPTAAKALREKREELGELLGRSARPVQVEVGKAFWWTFAGGRINYTLKYALEVIGGWKVVADNLLLRIEGDGVTHGAIDAVVDQMAGEAFWQDAGMWRAIVARLPEYRLSKFQRALPEAASVELVGGYMLDAAGTRGYLCKT